MLTDILQSRLDFAKQMGADYTLLSSRDVSEEDMVKKIHELLDGQPDVSFDASGAQATVRLAMLVSRHNTYFQMNLFHNGLLSHLYIRVIHIQNYYYTTLFLLLIRMLL